MKTNIIKLALLSFIILFASCESYVKDLNTDPNAFSDSPAELIIGQAQLGWAYSTSGENARYAGIFSNQFTGEDRQFKSVDEYIISANSFNSTWYITYIDALAQAQVTYKKAIKSDNKILAGIALITEAGIVGDATALWGDIPFSETGNPDIKEPKFDAQADVYASIQTKLSQAIKNVGNSPVTLYSGNRFNSTATWEKVAHSLKARYYLHVKDYANALDEAKKGFTTESESLMMTHGDSNNNSNLFYQFCVLEREGYLGATDSYLNKLLADPSLRFLNSPGDKKIAEYYFNGNKLNTEIDGVFAQKAPSPIISYEEVQLIMAESALRTGDEVEAKKIFNNFRGYLSSKYGSASFPQTTSTGNDLLLEILQEKYIALVGSLQVFFDLSRTKNAIGVPAKTGAKLPQRFLYPQDAIDTNSNTPNPIPGLFTPTPINNK